MSLQIFANSMYQKSQVILDAAIYLLLYPALKNGVLHYAMRCWAELNYAMLLCTLFFVSMLRYAMVCSAMLRDIMVWDAMLLWYSMLHCFPFLCFVMLWFALQRLPTLWCGTLCYVTLFFVSMRRYAIVCSATLRDTIVWDSMLHYHVMSRSFSFLCFAMLCYAQTLRNTMVWDSILLCYAMPRSFSFLCFAIRHVWCGNAMLFCNAMLRDAVVSYPMLCYLYATTSHITKFSLTIS